MPPRCAGEASARGHHRTPPQPRVTHSSRIERWCTGGCEHQDRGMLTGACGDRVPVGRGRARSEGGVYARRRQGKGGRRTGGRQEGTERRDGESEGEGGEREGRGRGEGQWREGRGRREGDLSTGGNFGIAGSLARQTVARAHICCAPALAQSPSRLQCRLRAAPSARDRMVAGPSTSVSPSVSARACAECMGVRRMHGRAFLPIIEYTQARVAAHTYLQLYTRMHGHAKDT